MSTEKIDYSKFHENRKYYSDNKKQLLKKYSGLYILIHNLNVEKTGKIGAELSDYGIKKYGAGNFSVEFCTEKEKAVDLSHIITINYGA